MVNSSRQTRKCLWSRGHYVLALAGAALLASGSVQLHAQTMGPWAAPMEEVDSDFVDDLLKNPNVVFVPVLRTAAPPEQRTGVGKAADSGHYTPSTDALQFTGACAGEAECEQHSGKDYIEVTGKISTEALGVSPTDPITEVIPALIIKVGNESCWWSCSGSTCDCVCVPAQTPPRCPRL